MSRKHVSRWWHAALVAGIVSLVGVVHAEDVMKLHVSPIVSEKDDLLVQVRLEKNSENQFMRVVAASDGYYGSSELQLDGQRTSLVTMVRFRSLPAGWYEVVGAVYDAQQHMRGSARTTVLVFPR
jgi:hypothetical protein